MKDVKTTQNFLSVNTEHAFSFDRSLLKGGIEGRTA